ncbi:unnamed protein product [Rotaria magnacalcarata]|uniref:Uncharacterized protein n=1 Tax=Rotaria magnacalcarata TaxID=392030 RepID=A0A816VAX0_9BILA|nr:unnamed protein product [Rotaria magnacalcarata]CAF4254807.1 unnamed protein product [Rotaria magnacalcarata]
MATTAANASSSTSICTICQTFADEKPKLGILPCLGCQQLFCYQHIGQHRQNLADQLDTVVINERNNLFENISKLEENRDQYVEQQVKEINDWELKSFEIIKETAENARLTLHATALSECSFLYLIRSRRPEWYHLYQWSIIGHGEPKKLELNISEKIYQITCYETNLLVLSHSFTIEKWKLNSLKLDTRWRKPMTCGQDESIQMIRMNSLYYALVVEKPDDCCFELRNNSMSIIGSVKVIYHYSLELINLPNEIGWLLFYYYNTRNPYIIDNQLNKHEQKFMEALQVKDIVTQGKYMIIRYDKQANDISKTKKNCIEYYQWH